MQPEAARAALNRWAEQHPVAWGLALFALVATPVVLVELALHGGFETSDVLMDIGLGVGLAAGGYRARRGGHRKGQKA